MNLRKRRRERSGNEIPGEQINRSNHYAFRECAPQKAATPLPAVYRCTLSSRTVWHQAVDDEDDDDGVKKNVTTTTTKGDLKLEGGDRGKEAPAATDRSETSRHPLFFRFFPTFSPEFSVLYRVCTWRNFRETASRSTLPAVRLEIRQCDKFNFLPRTRKSASLFLLGASGPLPRTPGAWARS